MIAKAGSIQKRVQPRRRGQASIEYLIILGFTFLMLIPLIYLFYTQQNSFQSDVAASQADKVVQKIADAADAVYYLGEPSQQTLLLNYPDNILNITVTGQSVSFLIEGTGGKYEVIKWTSANLTGNLSPSEGLHHVIVQAHGGVVVLSG